MVSIRRSGMMGAGGAAIAARVEALPVVLDVPRDEAALVEALVEAVRLSWACMGRVGPSAGGSVARDIPAHLIDRSERVGDYDARGGDLDDLPAPVVPAGFVEHAKVERLGRWLVWLDARPVRARERGGDVADGRLVAVIVRQLAGGRERIDWDRVLRDLHLARGKGMVQLRWRRAVAWLVGEIGRQDALSH